MIEKKQKPLNETQKLAAALSSLPFRPVGPSPVDRRVISHVTEFITDFIMNEEDFQKEVVAGNGWTFEVVGAVVDFTIHPAATTETCERVFLNQHRRDPESTWWIQQRARDIIDDLATFEIKNRRGKENGKGGVPILLLLLEAEQIVRDDKVYSKYSFHNALMEFAKEIMEVDDSSIFSRKFERAITQFKKSKNRISQRLKTRSLIQALIPFRDTSLPWRKTLRVSICD